MFLSLETLTSIIRTDFPILVELIYLVNSVITFLSQVTLLKCLTYPGCDSHSPALLDLFISSAASICSTMALPLIMLIILTMLLSQFPLTFHQIHNGMPRFIA